MTTHPNEMNEKRLVEKVDKLTEENQRCFLGVLEALNFARNTQKQTDIEIVEKEANSDGL